MVLRVVAVLLLLGEAHGFARLAPTTSSRLIALRSSLSSKPAPVVPKKTTSFFSGVKVARETLTKAVEKSKVLMASTFSAAKAEATKLVMLIINMLLQWIAALKRNDQSAPLNSLAPPTPAAKAPSLPMEVSEARKYASKVIEEMAVLEAQTAARSNPTGAASASVTAPTAVPAASTAVVSSPVVSSPIVSSPIVSSPIASSSSSSNTASDRSPTSSSSSASPIIDSSSSSSSSSSSAPLNEFRPPEEEQAEEDGNKITMAKIKSMGTSGILAYAVTELGFWLTSVPLALLALHAESGEWLSLTDEADRVKVLTFAATFITGARLLVPARLALAFAITPFVDSLRGKQGAAEEGAEERKV